MKTDFTNLKERMETSNVEKILIVEDEPSPAKCQKCKSYPCLGVNLSPKKTLLRVQIFKNILKIRPVNKEPLLIIVLIIMMTYSSNGRMEVSTGVITDIKRDLNTIANREAKPDNLKTSRITTKVYEIL